MAVNNPHGIVDEVISADTICKTVKCLPCADTPFRGEAIVKIYITNGKWSIFSVIVNKVAIPYAFEVDVEFDISGTPEIVASIDTKSHRYPSGRDRTQRFCDITIKFHLDVIKSVTIYGQHDAAYAYAA